MAFTVEVHGVSVKVDTLEELDTIVRRYGKRAARASVSDSEAPALFEANGNGDRVTRRKIRGVKVHSKNKVEAATKLFRSLRLPSQVAGLSYLAQRGEQGASAEELREVSGMPGRHRMSGFTSAVVRRCEAFGLEPADVLVVQYLGAVGGDRIYRYKIGPEMAKALKELE